MTRPVPLIRRFTPVSRHYQDHDVDLEQIWSVLDRGERRDWGRLREDYRAVILADAGAGKTYELQAEAGRMVARGEAAFFIRIEDIDANFGSAFEVSTAEAFERWLAGTSEAWFFLDSVDEVRLEAPRAFETALRSFAGRIHDARHRAHVYISSRPYAWRPKLDRELIDALLPWDPPRPEQAGEESAPPQDDLFDGGRRKREEETGLNLYRLAPLDRDDIRIFAGHRGVGDAGALLDAVERGALLNLVQLPFDLEDIIAVWQESGSLDSRLAVLERGIRRRLAPPPNLGQAAALSLDRALEGAERLALAATLTGHTNIQMPGGQGAGLDAAALLDDWDSDEIEALFGRGVFSDAIYGMVRFRHRETRELLAARCLAGGLADETARPVVEGMIFRTVYGEEVIVPRLRPLLPWLILFDDRIRDRALHLMPKIASEGGDAARLPFAVRQRMLRAIVADIVSGDARGGDNSEIARIAQTDLTDDALALIDAHGDNDDAVFFLGRLAWQGTMRVPAQRLESVATDSARGIYARIVSVRAVALVVGADAAQALWEKLIASGEILPRRLLAELIDSVPAELRFVDLLARSLDTLEPYERFSATGLSQAMHGFIDRLPLVSDRAPEQALAALVEGLAGFLAREPHLERRECRISQQFRWLMAPAMHAVERLIVARSSACFGSAAMATMAQVPALRSWGGEDAGDYKSKLGELIPRWTDLNDALFWHCVAAARAAREPDDKPVVDDWDVSWMGHLWSFDPASFLRTLDWITTRDLPDDRQVALARTFRSYVQHGRPRAWRRPLWRAVAGDPVLEAKLGTLMRPPPSAVNRRWRANERKWAQRRRLREENENRWRAEFVARLKANPDLVRAPPGLKPGEMSYDQAHLLQSIEGDGLRMSRRAGARWRTLVPEFGEAVAEAFRDAALRQWRAYQPKLRSEGDGSTTIPYALIFAMAGLEIEAGEECAGIADLPEDEARHALLYVTHELNGFPTWFEPLYRARADMARDLVWGESRWELANSPPDQPMHYVLHDLVYHAPWLHAELARPICDWLLDHGAANGDCLRYGRTIMVSGGLDAASLAALARTRVADSATPPDQLASWFALWVDAAPAEAVSALEARLAGLSPPDDARFAEQFVGALVGGRREGGPSLGLWRTPENLKALYALMHRHIRVAEDIDRTGGGAYSPTARDDAQDARSHLFSLLAAIPGETTYREILQLAEDHPEPDYRAHMRRKARDRAVEDSDREWTLADIRNLPRASTMARKDAASIDEMLDHRGGMYA